MRVYRIRTAVLAMLVCVVCGGCVAAVWMLPGWTPTFYLGFDGKTYKTQGEADQTFQTALAEVPERERPVADRALIVLPSPTAIGLYELKLRDTIAPMVGDMAPSFGSKETVAEFLGKRQALFAEALRKRNSFKQLSVEKSDRPGAVLRPEYEVNILVVLKDSGQEECLVKTSPLNFSLVTMPGINSGGGGGLIQWLEALEDQAASLLKRQKQVGMAR